MTQRGQTLDGQASWERLGTAISLSANGGVMAMGAPGDANVRVLALEENVLVQRGARLTGAASDENFGESTSLSASGDVVAVGAYWADGGGWRAGRVQVFQWAGAEWKQLGQDIDGAADGDESGRSIALSADGTALAVGAYYNDGGGYWAGHVRVFALVRDEWIQRGADIEGEAERDRSGSAVSLSGDGSVLAVGAYYNDGGGDYSGHARVFAWVEDSKWEQLGSDIDGEAAGDRLGEAVALSTDGKVLALGAERNHGGGTHNGHVRVFTYDGDDWKQRGSDINGEQAYDSMGWSVSLSADGAILAIGSPRNRYVKVFEFVDDEWTQRGADIVTPSEHDDFGHAVALSSDGSTVAVGAPYAYGSPDLPDGGPWAGQVRVYQASSGSSSDDGKCLEDCFGKTCDYWGDYWANQQQKDYIEYTCANLEAYYGCACSGCTCARDDAAGEFGQGDGTFQGGACVDDATWSHTNKKNKEITCAKVARNAGRRCALPGAAAACERTCGEC